jgi:lipoyl(octanoyl) transferase
VVDALQFRWLGRMPYEAALAEQERLVATLAGNPDGPETILLLEHDPVFTIGRSPDQSSLRDASALPHPVHVTNRGGQATYHGPGQLVGYPILDLRRRGQDLHKYLRLLEEFVIAVCKAFGVAAQAREGLTGVWVADRKIASLGVGVRRWVTMHGFALNVTDESLASFAKITPCGIQDVRMTSLEREGAAELTVRSVAEWIEENGSVLDAGQLRELR